MTAPRRRRRESPPAYHLEVGRGYVRLVRAGGFRSRPITSRRYVRLDDNWVEDDGEPGDALAEEADRARAAEEEAKGGIDERAPLDPVVEAVIDDATHRARGAKGPRPGAATTCAG